MPYHRQNPKTTIWIQFPCKYVNIRIWIYIKCENGNLQKSKFECCRLPSQWRPGPVGRRWLWSGETWMLLGYLIISDQFNAYIHIIKNCFLMPIPNKMLTNTRLITFQIWSWDIRGYQFNRVYWYIHNPFPDMVLGWPGSPRCVRPLKSLISSPSSSAG